MISINAIISLIICFAKFTDPIRDVTDIGRIFALRTAGSRGWSHLFVPLPGGSQADIQWT